ncbi:calcium-binding protein [Pseudodonghicola flavimaris]|uniref:Calcium-binding protein n=1 Tax=Pseudodonghicola flavimaris TaxID=3050036 RepID=A0ABT7F3R4_9RHOB|nr:calcium-binding protein [Pseudodonghicola flavimaris]MDK3019248.1 calcium-binding protein [Pseudodonghicola flavimaris]
MALDSSSPAVVPVAAVADRIDSLLDGYRSRIETAVFRSDIPLLGQSFADTADQVLGFVDTLKTGVRTALEGIGTATATLEEIAAAVGLAGPELGATIRADGTLALEFDHDAVISLAAETAAAALGGLGTGIAFDGTLDLDATVEAGLVLVLDAETGSVRVDTSPGQEFGLDLFGRLLPEGGVELGFLDSLLGGWSAADGIDLSFDVDLDGSAVHATLSGGATFGRGFETTAASDILPVISGDLNLGFDFAALALEDGVAIDVAGRIGLENLTLDMGGLVDFLNAVLGQITAITDSFPFGTVLDILTTPIPVIDAIAPGSLDKTGDGSITAADFILAFGSDSDNMGFVTAIEALVDALETIDDLRDLAYRVDLGDLVLSAEATTEARFDLDGDGVSATAETDLLDLIAGSGLDGLLTGSLGAGIEASDRLDIPLLSDPLGTLGALLLNGYYGAPVTLVSYDLPPLGFSVAPRIPFDVGPLSFFIGGSFAAETDFGIGYDTAGFTLGGVEFGAGFYVTTVDGTRVDPFLTLSFGMEAGGGVGAGVAKVSIVGGVGGVVDLFLAGGGEKTRLADLGGCLFNPITGRIEASLEVEVRIGIGKLSVTDRVTIGETVLAQFGFDPCDSDFDPATLRFSDTELARKVAGGELALNVGAASGRRDVPGRIDLDPAFDAASDAELETLEAAGVNTRARDEVVYVGRAPEGSGDTAAALAVSAFGIYEVYDRTAGFSLISGDGGSGDDRLTVAADLDVAVAFAGGSGHDTLTGGAAADVLSGNGGRDVLTGHDGDDVLKGMNGDDILIGGAGADVLNGGAGIDEADYSGAAEGIRIVNVTTAGVTTRVGRGGEARGDLLTSIEYVKGTDYDDRIEADPVADSTLDGRGGDDVLIGGVGDDLLSGGAGADRLDGGDGEDAVSYAFSTAGVLIDLEHGVIWGGDASGDTLENIEIYQLTWQADSFFGATTGRVGDVVYGFEGNDLLDGGAGRDRIFAGGGDDTVVGGADGDRLDGGTGRDLLTFEHHFDATLGSKDGVEIDLAAGTATEIAGGRSDTLLEDDAGNSSFEDVTGSRLYDVISGDGKANVLRGLAGQDVLSGAGGDDTLIGGADADELTGGAGFDTADYSASGAGVTVDLAAGTGAGGDAEGDSLTGIEAVRGSGGDDVLLGNLRGNDLDIGVWTGFSYDEVDGNGGIDRVIVSWSDAEEDISVVKLSTTWARIYSGAIEDRDLRAEIWDTEDATILTGAGDDLIASVVDNETEDLPGIDHFAGDDYIATGAGADRIAAGSGADQVFAGLGDDTVWRDKATKAETFVMDGGQGIDRLIADLSYDTAGVVLASYSPLSESGLAFSVAGGGVFAGFEILEKITTGSGEDQLTQLGAVDSEFHTGDGADTVTLDYGDNLVWAGSDGAVDTLILDYSGERLMWVDAALETPAVIGDPAGLNVRLKQGSGPIFVLKGNSTYYEFERLVLTGSRNDDVIAGLDGRNSDDVLDGQAGDDVISGGRGNDVIVGGAGTDLLEGGIGDDTLIGGLAGVIDGRDGLTGGAGSDLFVLGDETGSHYGAAAEDVARIEDFDIAEDRLQLAGSAADYSVSVSAAGHGRITLTETGELVAVLMGAGAVSLSDPAVSFVAVTDPVASSGSGRSGGAATLTGPVPLPEPFEIHDYGVIDPFEEVLRDGLADLGARSITTVSASLAGNPGSAKAFSDAPFGLEEGVVLSTGVARDLAAENRADGSDSRGILAGSEADLVFEKLGVTAGGSAIFRADVSGLAGGLKTLTLTDSLNLEGADSLFSGFDLDGIFLSPDRIDAVGGVVDLTGVATLDVFDYSPIGTRLEAGTMRNPGLFTALGGTVNGMIDESVARLGAVDYTGSALDGGAVSLGDGGSATFELTETVATDGPLYLYVGEAYDAGEALSGRVQVSDGDSSAGADASTDIGTPGAADDWVTLSAELDVDLRGGADWAVADLFNVVIVTEAFPEFAGTAWQDIVDVKVNGLSALVLGDGRQATLQNLAAAPDGAFAEELLFNLVGEGAHAAVLSADAYTTILRVSAPILDGLNSFAFSVADGGDGLGDTAIFVSALIADTVRGDSGNNRLFGSSADDLMLGREGSDTMWGGHGWDTYRFKPAHIAEDVIDETTGSGFDRIELDVYVEEVSFTRDGDDLLLHYGGTGSGQSIRVAGQYADDLPVPMVEEAVFSDATRDLTGVLEFTGSTGNDRGLRGTDLGETIDGLRGNDRIAGLGGDDRLRGGAGRDRIDGGTGDDRISGDGGNDILIGGLGSDRLSGRAGRDSFVFTSVAESATGAEDVITDFTRGKDLLDFTGFDRALYFLGGRDFYGEGNELRFDADLNRIELDYDGDREADFAVVLEGIGRITATDLLL